MWIVRLALRRPYTFIVLAILIAILGLLSIVRTPVDIFPSINIPVVSIVWTFTGLDAQQMSDRIVTITERALTTTVDNIQHIESQSLDGVAVVKLFLQPGASLVQAIAQVTAVSQTQLRQLPTGTTPPLEKAGSASTLAVVSGIKAMVPQIASSLPPQLQITPVADQSVFVRASISGVAREAVIAASLTALMILTFLGNWRSTLIIATSIPLAILTSLIALGAIGETINIQTLGGLALAVGILVDDATVEIGNINRQAAMGKPILQAILDGAQEIAVPAFVSTLSICIVFVPMFFLSGVARYLFVPLAEAVIFAMLASYLLSRTLVPTMARYLLRGHEHECGRAPRPSRNPLVRMQRRFEHGFERLRHRYRRVLESCLRQRGAFLAVVFGFCVASLILVVPWLGEDYFPTVDAGQIRLHVSARTGTLIEDTAQLCDLIENSIRRHIPKRDLASIIDNIGLPYSGINLSYSTSAPIGSWDADIMIALAPGHRPTAEYVHDLRFLLNRAFPGTTFSFLPADIVGQILNFGLPSPIDIQITGMNLEANRKFAISLLREVKAVAGTVDLRIQQPSDRQTLNIAVDRTKASQVGLTMRDVATNLLTSLSGSFQTSPTFWLNTQTHVSYQIATQTPQYRIHSLQDLQNVPITGAAATSFQILANLGTITRTANDPVVSHYDIQPVIDIFGAVQGRDLGAVASDLAAIIDRSRPDLPRGSQVVLRGQVETMRSSYTGLIAGLAFAIVLVYLLMVVNFQSWLSPLIVITALPAALAGIAWFLFVTRTPLSVPALMGSIMAMGVATSNSILVVTFCNEQVALGKDAIAAPLEAGFTRFRPVIMTALAMTIGLLPMALGLGEGGEQNAPLGRAVIGGLMFATVSTLLFVPSFFSWLYGWRTRREKPHSDGSHAG